MKLGALENHTLNNEQKKKLHSKIGYRLIFHFQKLWHELCRTKARHTDWYCKTTVNLEENTVRKLKIENCIIVNGCYYLLNLLLFCLFGLNPCLSLSGWWAWAWNLPYLYLYKYILKACENKKLYHVTYSETSNTYNKVLTTRLNCI